MNQYYLHVVVCFSSPPTIHRLCRQDSHSFSLMSNSRNGCYRHSGRLGQPVLLPSITKLRFPPNFDFHLKRSRLHVNNWRALVGIDAYSTFLLGIKVSVPWGFRQTSLMKRSDSAFIVLNNIRLHLPYSSSKHESRSIWVLRSSKTEPLKKLQATDGHVIVEFESITCLLQCLCGRDDPSGSDRSEGGRISREYVGCPAWAKITATARQDSESNYFSFPCGMPIVPQPTKSSRSTAFKAFSSTRMNARPLPSQRPLLGFPFILTSRSMPIGCSTISFRWQ